jgi:hypothetical protein
MQPDGSCRPSNSDQTRVSGRAYSPRPGILPTENPPPRAADTIDRYTENNWFLYGVAAARKAAGIRGFWAAIALGISVWLREPVLPNWSRINHYPVNRIAIAAIMPDIRSVMEQTDRIRRTVGPHSRRVHLGMIDGRRREAKLMAALVADLTAHVGGRPSAVQRALIHRAAALHLRLTLMDAQTEPGGGMSEKNAREYLCWSNAYARLLGQLGMAAAPSQNSPGLPRLLSGMTQPTPAAQPPSRARSAATA